MLAEEIRIHLLSDTEPGAHQPHADLRATEPHDLDPAILAILPGIGQ